MSRFDLNVNSIAIEIICAESRHRIHKTSCKDIKLSQLYNYNVKTRFQLTCTVNDRQRTGQRRVTTRIYGRTMCMLPRLYLIRPSIFTAS